MRRATGHRVAIGLGSNLGDRLANLRFARMALAGTLEHVAASPVYETVPVHVTDQPPFLNACCTGRTRLTPRQLLSELQQIERLARRRPGGVRYGPRTLDLDLLLYDERTIEEPDLVIPHPRLAERAFVLTPLRDIAADWRVPGSGGDVGRSVAELSEAVGSDGVERTEFRLEDR